ncbi:MAG: hypothetical protein P8Z81_14425 [Deinococcales bacterium]
MRGQPSVLALLGLLGVLAGASGAVRAAAQPAPLCVPELRESLTGVGLDRAATGTAAAVVLERAVKLVEPALPPLVTVKQVPIGTSSPYYADVRYLAERRLLPGSWKPVTIDATTWQDMLNRFQGWYKLSPSTVSGPNTVADLIRDAGTVLGRVSQAIRPAALLASDPADPNRIAFWAIIWNWTVYPRLIVLHPPTNVTLANGPAAVLPHMSDCAVHITSYVMATAQDAARLFLATNQSHMYVVGSVPAGSRHWPAEVAAGKELDTFTYQAPTVETLDIYAAVFDGPQVGFTKVLGLLPKLQTNMTPWRFLSFMKTP